LYIETIEELVNTPIDIISTGPARDQIIQKINILDV
jgi:adenylosuccinate synthase